MSTGHWHVLDSESGAPLFSSNPASEAIQAIRFSPDDTQVALGSRNNTCYIYKVDGNSDEYILRGKCTVGFHIHIDKIKKMIISYSFQDRLILPLNIEDLKLISSPLLLQQ